MLKPVILHLAVNPSGYDIQTSNEKKDRSFQITDNLNKMRGKVLCCGIQANQSKTIRCLERKCLGQRGNNLNHLQFKIES